MGFESKANERPEKSVIADLEQASRNEKKNTDFHKMGDKF